MNTSDWLKRWLFTTNHKDVGLLYFFTSLYFGVVGAILALMIRVQLSVPNNDFLTALYFNQAVTMHGLIMILWFLSPLAIGLFNYLVPLQIGAKDLAFPRLNALSYWLFLAGGMLAALSFFAPGGSAAAGWTTYQPLASPAFQPGPGPTMAYLGLVLLAASVTVGSVNFVVSIIWLRAPGMTFGKLPMFTWFSFFTIIAMLYAFPSVVAAFALAVSDRLLGTVFFTSPGVLAIPGLSPSLLWENLFWFFGHPEVYVVILPSLGVISNLIPVFTGRPLSGRNWILISTAIIILPLSFGVWMHHMFLTGIPLALQEVFDVSTEAISIPFGIIIISFLLSMIKGRIQLKAPFLFVLGALMLFIFGGIMGVFLSSPVLDRVFRGSYFVVSHFHYVMVGATIFGLFAGIYYWMPLMTKKMYNTKLANLHFLASFIGFNVLYFPLAFLSDMPRRIFTYQNIGDWALFNSIATVGAFIFAGAQIFLAANLLNTWFRGPPAPGNPWGSTDLEWSSMPETPSPAVAPEIQAPPGGWIGQLATPPAAAPHSAPSGAHEVHLSSRPLEISLGVLVFFIGAAFYPDVAGMGAMAVGVGIALFALLGWSRDDFRESFHAPADGEGERWPFAAIPKMKLGMWTFLSSEIILFGSILGAYIFIRGAVPGWPSPSTIHDIPLGTLNTVILATSGLTMVLALNAIKKGNQRGLLSWLGVTFVLGATFMGIKLSEWSTLVSSGFVIGSSDPMTTLVASTYYFVVGLHGAHVVVGLLVMVYLMKKTLAGKYSSDSHLAIENFGLYWAFVDIVWCFVFPLFYLL